jgi:hypothetical protein
MVYWFFLCRVLMAARINLDATYNQRFDMRQLGATFDPVGKVWFTTDPTIAEAWTKRKTDGNDTLSRSNYSRGPSGKGLDEKYTTRKQILKRMWTLVEHRDVAFSDIAKANAKIGASVMEFRRLVELMTAREYDALNAKEREDLEPPSLNDSISQVTAIFKKRRQH